MRTMKSLFLSFVATSLFSTAVFAQTKPLSELAEGKPNLIDAQILNDQSYVEVPVVKLAQPKLLWANLSLLREMGYDVPEKLDAKTTQTLLDTLAWVSKDSHTADADIVPDTKKIMRADFYGGEGLGANFGSARAASAGDIQVKGVGITPHLKRYDSKHTARSTVHEAIKDAVWGEMLNNELPYGANRIVAIIDRGGALENGEPQILEIRQDPVRMGHFIVRSFYSDSADTARVESISQNLLKALPQPQKVLPATATMAQKLISGWSEYARRIGVQYAQMHMRRLFHGATSQSNIEINGRMIDFGTASSQPAYEKVGFLTHVQPFGDREEVRRVLIQSFPEMVRIQDDAFAQELRRYALPGENWKSSIAKTMLKSFDQAYLQESRVFALKLMGFPEEWILRNLKKHNALADFLVELTRKNVQPGTPRVELTQLSTMKDRGVGALQGLAQEVNALEKMEIESLTKIFDKYAGAAGEEMALKYKALYADAEKSVSGRGVSRNHFRSLVIYNSRFLNRPVEALYLPDLKKATTEVTSSYMRGDLHAPAALIENIKASSLRTIQGLPWYQAPVRVLSEVGQNPKVKIFDATTGRTSTISYQSSDRQISSRKFSEVRSGAGMSCKRVHAR